MIKKKRFLCTAVTALMVAASAMPVYGDSIDEETLISDVTVPEDGTIQYDVLVPAGSTVNYEVSLTPDKETGTVDRVEGMWKNTTKENITKTITAKVKFLSGEYVISAQYTSNVTKEELKFEDRDTAVKSYKGSHVHNRLILDMGEWDDMKGSISNYLKKVSGLLKYEY